ncbi:sugar phosphate isomerase/epimerase family protein [Nesterenkonia sp. HG001]|uniref:sugar phosphate isomerase/epimerase family protein n=1 Tax=Nesterenkonia sp. HG001 TaxID=2983207 RepID=UPI002AC7A2B3|nr:sugar phosphate isomerase/epimerase family protein [Nesterenkonia sp. HG001]MDZ5076426.1 sugar phosphate isomerase/epimerase [Nesterenkonia sp. HG001]
MKYALDPTPFHQTHSLLEFPKLAAELGFEWLQMTPHADFIPFHNHPKADDDLVARFRKACSDAGVGVASVLPVLRWSSPEPDAREAAVRYWKRAIQITVDLGVDQMNTEFSGRPERAEESERAFYRSLEELLPIIESEGINVAIDPHPDDFVEQGLAGWRVIRGANSKNLSFAYVAPHTFHYEDPMATVLDEVGDRLRVIHVADTFDHHRSNGLRYITNPPGTPARVHQHNKIGVGDVDWDHFFSELARNGFDQREETVMVSGVFGENEDALEVSTYQRRQMRDRMEAARG